MNASELSAPRVADLQLHSNKTVLWTQAAAKCPGTVVKIA